MSGALLLLDRIAARILSVSEQAGGWRARVLRDLRTHSTRRPGDEDLLTTTGRVVNRERRASVADRRACGGWHRSSAAGSAEVVASSCRRVRDVIRDDFGDPRWAVASASLFQHLAWIDPTSSCRARMECSARRRPSRRFVSTTPNSFWLHVGNRCSRCGGCAVASGFSGARLDGVSALCGRYSGRDHRMLTRANGDVYPGSGSGQATPVNHAASDLQANDLGRTHRRSETIASVTDGHGCRPRARCGKTVAIVCWRGARSRFLIASRGGSRMEQWIRCGGGVGR